MTKPYTLFTKPVYRILQTLFLFALIWCSPYAAQAQCTVNAQWSSYSLGGDSLRFIAYDTNSTAHHIFNWGDGTYSSGTTDTTHHYASPGTYHVCFYCYIPGTACSDSLCETITVSTPCTTTAQWSYYSLGGDSLRFYAYDTTSGAYHIWNWGDGSYTSQTTLTTHHYANPGTYRVCFYAYYTPNGCADSLCEYVTVGNACQSGFTYQIVPHTDSVVFSSTATGTDSITAYDWSFGDTTYSHIVGSHPSHTYSQAGTYIACLAIGTAGGCQSTHCDTIVITTPCTLNTTWSYTNTGNNTIAFNGADTGSSLHRYWTFGDGTTSTTDTWDPTHTYAQAGTYTVCLHAYIPGGCIDSFCQNVVVNPSYTCHVTADWLSYSLGGDSMRFYNADTNSTAHHIWSWGDGTVTSGTTLTNHTFPAAGTYHVCFYCYIPGTTCSDSMCENVTVGTPPCTATAQWSSYSLGGDSIRFYAYDTSSAAHFYWSWGDGSTTVGPRDTIHIFPGAGTYHVCLYMYIAGTNCGDSLCQNITIAGSTVPCNIRYGWTYTSTGGDSASFSAEDTVSAAHHIFNFGDGTSSTNNATHVSHVYAQPGTYHVCFYVYIPGTTCSDSLCQNVTIVASNPCHVTALWSDYSLGGDSLRFYSTDTNTAAHHIWVWGDGTYTSGVTTTIHHYLQPGTYHVCYYVYIPGTTCSDSLCDNVTVGTSNTCNITADWTYYSLGGDSIRFYAYDTNTTAHIIWNFGDGASAYGVTGINHHYLQPGTYHVCLYVYLPQTNCFDSSCSTVTIAASTPPCTTTAAWVSYALGGDSVRFYAADTNSAAHHIFNWGDGTYTSGATATTHVFPGAGTYHVCFYCYIPGSACSDSLCDNITVAGNPCHITAQWAAYSLGGDTVNFYSADTNTAAHHIWVFGDGSYISGSTYASHVYADTGTYHVCYYVYIPGTECMDSLCGNVMVSGQGFQISAFFYQQPLGGDTVGFTAPDDTSSSAYDVWSFGDGTYEYNTTNPTHVYAQSGTYTVCFYTFIPGTNIADSTCETVDIVLGINNINSQNIRIIAQPNPFNQSVLIRAEGLNGAFDFKLYDVVGKLIHYEKGVNGSFILERGSLTSGMYLFEVVQDGKVLGTGKIIAE
jgi:PKD repeat protein